MTDEMKGLGLKEETKEKGLFEKDFFRITKKDMMYGIIVILMIVTVYYAGNMANAMIVNQTQTHCPCVIGADALMGTVYYESGSVGKINVTNTSYILNTNATR